MRTPVLVTISVMSPFCLLLPSAAQSTDEVRASEDWHRTVLVIEALTDFPLDVGARVSVDTPYGFRIATGLRGMP